MIVIQTDSQQMSIQLISFDEKSFKLTHQGEVFLRSLNNSTQIGILSILGKSRTGKSFFLNEVLLQSQQFQTSHTTNPCTKGIWVSQKLIDSPCTPGLKIMLMDIEGLDGTQDNSISNNKILLFPLILSSYLIYNSMGYITEEAIRSLGVVLGLAQQLQEEKGQFSLPFFHWIIRDFTLQLTDSLGYPITQKQYLERSLEDQKGESADVKNKIRRKFKQYFRQRDCSTLIRPYKQQIKDLRPQFINQSEIIRSKIFSQTKHKQIRGVRLTPSLLLQFIENILVNVNNGVSLCVENTWKVVYLQHQKDLLSQLQYRMFDEIEKLKEQELPVAFMRIKAKFQESFQDQSLSGRAGFPQQIQNQINRIVNEIKNHIDQKIRIVQQKKGNQELNVFINEIKLSDFVRNIKSVQSINQQVTRLISVRGFMLCSYNQNRIKQIKQKLRNIIIQELCNKLQNQNKQIEEQNQFLKKNCQEGLISSRKLQKQFNQANETIIYLETEIEHSKKQKDIIIRNLEEELWNRKVKQQQQNEQIASLNRKLELADSSGQYSMTVKRIQELEGSLDSIQKQYAFLIQEQGELKGLNFILKQQKIELEKTIANLKKQSQNKDEQILEIENRIMKQVERQQERVEQLLEAASTREREKNQRIEKLQRIIKELKSKPQKLDQEMLRSKRLELDLNAQKSRNTKLEKQIEELKEIYEYKLANLIHKKQPLENKSAIMNLELTSEGLKMKSFKSPSKLKQWQKEKICLEAQISLQQQLTKQSKTVISSLLQKQEEYIRQIDQLKLQLRQYQNDCSQLSSIKSLKENKDSFKHIKTKNWDVFSTVTAKVPSFTVKQVDDGHSITEYLVEFKSGSSQWDIKIRFKQLAEMLEHLFNKYPSVQQIKLNKTGKAEDKRKDIQKSIQQCLMTHEYRNDVEFKKFISMKQYQSNTLFHVDERINSPKKKIKQGKENLKIKSGDKSSHFSIYIDS